MEKISASVSIYEPSASTGWGETPARGTEYCGAVQKEAGQGILEEFRKYSPPVLLSLYVLAMVMGCGSTCGHTSCEG